MWLWGWIEGICTTWSFALSEVSSSVSFILPCTNTHGAWTPTQEHTGKNKRTHFTSDSRMQPWVEYKLAVLVRQNEKFTSPCARVTSVFPTWEHVSCEDTKCRAESCTFDLKIIKKHLLLKQIDSILTSKACVVCFPSCVPQCGQTVASD